jgi:predicted phosphoribosyltransferase
MYMHPACIAVVVPIASVEAVYLLKQEVNEVSYVMAPEPFDGVGKWYGDFSQTTDEEVKYLLNDVTGQK